MGYPLISPTRGLMGCSEFSLYPSPTTHLVEWLFSSPTPFEHLLPSPEHGTTVLKPPVGPEGKGFKAQDPIGGISEQPLKTWNSIREEE